MKKLYLLVLISLGFGFIVSANDYGAEGALQKKTFTTEEMLAYAIEDEYLALREYEALVEELRVSRPFTNIIESEKQHIKYIEELYKKYKMEIPDVDPEKYLYIPESVTEAAKIGVDAEIKNISMYETFLDQELPDDIREVFEFLRNASKNHLRAFERQL